MLDFILRTPFIQSAQRFIDRLTPKVQVHLHQDLPLPSVGTIKRISTTVVKINAFKIVLEVK